MSPNRSEIDNSTVEDLEHRLIFSVYFFKFKYFNDNFRWLKHLSLDVVAFRIMTLNIAIKTTTVSLTTLNYTQCNGT
jgi:hypothetical protein